MSVEALIWCLSVPSKIATANKSYIKKPSNNVFFKILFSYCYITGKFNMKFSVWAREENCFMAKNFWAPILLFQLFVSFSRSAVLQYKDFGRDRKPKKCDPLQISP